MPTILKSSSARLWQFFLERFGSCARIASVIWSPNRSTGLSAFMALCMTMEISDQQNWLNCVSEREKRSRPLNCTSPPVITAGGCSRRRMPCATVDLPLPDSPARPKTSPGAISKETPSTARTGGPSVAYSMRRSRMESSGLLIAPGTFPAIRGSVSMANHRCGAGLLLRTGTPLCQRLARDPLRLEAGIGHFVDGEVGQGKGKGDERDCYAGGDDRPPGAS